MSDLNFMEKLLEGVEVEWKSLSDIADFKNGKGHEKEKPQNALQHFGVSLYIQRYAVI